MTKRKKSFLGLIPLALVGALAVWQYGPSQSHGLSDRVQTQGRPMQSRRLASPQIPESRLMAGVVEGFYGPQWSDAETKHVLRFMRREGFNTFVYAPKNAPYLRARWDQLYPPSVLKRVADLVHTAQSSQIQFICSISPGLSIQYGSVRAQDQLMAKINQLWSVGIHSFMLSFDDIPGQLPPSQAAEYHNNLALAQSTLVDKIYREQRHEGHSIEMLFTPTAYWGVKDNVYWETLKAHLNAQIPVIWTGPWVLSKTITRREVLSVKRQIGHPLIIWDNYPVNDYTYVIEHHPQLFMGPLRGRGPNVVSAVRGYLFNPMLQPYASELALATGASYLRNPAMYRPQSAWLQALGEWHGPTEQALKSFAGANSVSYLDATPTDSIQSHMTSFWQSYAHHKNLMDTALYKQFVRWDKAATVLHRSLPPTFYEEIKPWVSTYQHEAQLGMRVIQALDHPNSVRASTVRALMPQQEAINNSASQLGVHAMLEGWFAKAFQLPPFSRP